MSAWAAPSPRRVCESSTGGVVGDWGGAGPIPGERGPGPAAVEVSANAVIGRGSGGVERTASRADGTFELFNYPPRTDDLGKQLGKGIVFFSHPDHIGQRFDDVYALAPERRESLRIVLGTGR